MSSAIPSVQKAPKIITPKDYPNCQHFAFHSSNSFFTSKKSFFKNHRTNFLYPIFLSHRKKSKNKILNYVWLRLSLSLWLFPYLCISLLLSHFFHFFLPSFSFLPSFFDFSSFSYYLKYLYKSNLQFPEPSLPESRRKVPDSNPILHHVKKSTTSLYEENRCCDVYFQRVRKPIVSKTNSVVVLKYVFEPML